MKNNVYNENSKYPVLQELLNMYVCAGSIFR
jgi:hypothetical protein